MSFFNIPATLDFSEILAKECENLSIQTGISLPEFKIYLPTRRAIRTLQESFLRLSEGKPRLLPLMQPIGDADLEETHFTDDFSLDILPPIDGLRRQLALANLLEKAWPYDYNYQQALSIAADLSVLIDQIHTENLDVNDIHTIMDKHEFAEYWQITSDFLVNLLGKVWPEFLRVEGKIDSGLYRRLRIERINQFYQNHPSQTPVIMAGSTGSIPATRQFIKTIGSMSNGYVFLPALDKVMDDLTWHKVGEGHPQYLLKNLIEACKIKRENIPDIGIEYVNDCRLQLMSEMMRPASKTDEWINLSITEKSAAIQKGLDGVTLIEAESDHHEAMCIALAMLEVAADKAQTKTAILMTPDRYLAMRVQQNLRQWGIDIDDSGGTSLTNSIIGHFALSVLQSFNNNQVNPIAFLACLKNPMMGQSDFSTRTCVRALEKELFRGVRPIGGFDNLIEQSKNNKDFLRMLQKCFEPLNSLQKEKYAINTIVNAHILVLENLAKTTDKSGAQRLWIGDDGECLAQLLSNIINQSDVLPNMNLDEYFEFFQSLISRKTYTAKYGKHPRLSILGQIESRMIYADRLILAGVNENIWPPDSGFDAWMSRKMRTDFHLPSLEQKTTLAAHDFSIGFCSPEVFITRSKKSGGQPTLPSRWLNRLDTVLNAANIAHEKWPQTKGYFYTYLANYVRHTDSIKSCERPSPRPSIDRRPLQFSVTEIEKWMRDPYWIYAKKILNLKKLDSVDMDLSVAERGSIIHDAIDKFVKQNDSFMLPDDAYEKLIENGEEVFGYYDENPQIHGLWWPRFTRAAKWFIDHEREWRINTDIIYSEIKGSMNLAIGDRVFILTGKADRIEKRVDDKVAFIDYKTGSAPKAEDVNLGVASQLPLEALILNQGGFETLKNEMDSAYILQYWSLSGSGEGGMARPAQGMKGKDSHILIEEAYDGIKSLFTAFLNPDIAYLSCPDSSIMIENKYNDYAHLERISEWSINPDEAEG